MLFFRLNNNVITYLNFKRGYKIIIINLSNKSKIRNLSIFKYNFGFSTIFLKWRNLLSHFFKLNVNKLRIKILHKITICFKKCYF